MRKGLFRHLVLVFLPSLTLMALGDACGSSSSGGGASETGHDSGASTLDSSTSGSDSGAGSTDSGLGGSDTGTSTNDSGMGATDSGAGPSPVSRYVYTDGVLNKTDWPYDYSYGNAVEDFTDKTDPEPGHTDDFKFSVGGWQPAAVGYNTPPYGLDLSAYTYMSFDINPQTTESPNDMGWHYIGDINGGTTDLPTSAYISDITKWGGKLTELEWTTIRIPMAAFGVLDSVHTYKFFLRNNGGGGAFLLDNVGFVAGNFTWAYAGDNGPSSGWSDGSTKATANYAYQPANFQGSLVSLNGTIAPGTNATSKNVVQLSVTATGGALRLNSSAGQDLSAYDHLTFGAIPTKSGYAYRVQFYDKTGAAVGNAVDPSNYTGQDWGANNQYWTVYCVPLSTFGSIGTTIGGFSIADDSGDPINVVYLSAIGFYK